MMWFVMEGYEVAMGVLTAVVVAMFAVLVVEILTLNGRWK